MKEALELLNQMQKDGVIESYAIGGAVAATYYLEPVSTIDLDIFVTFSPSPETSLISLSPIYDYLTARGGRIENEYMVIGDWPVQFLPASDALECDALKEARTVDLEGTPTRVLQSEHLLAIALRTGRPKDQARIMQFLSEKAVNPRKMDEILKTYGLISKWQTFKKRFIDG
jgi:hypothetical protein